MWRVLGAAVTGTSHRATGKGCEDAFGWLDVGDTTCLVVADGAGSRPYSAQGSAAAVAAVLDSVRQSGGREQPTITALFQAALDAIESASSAHGHGPDDYATTLAVALLSPNGTRIGQIGDGVTVAKLASGDLCAISPQARFEYANETLFLTSDGAIGEIRESSFGPSEVLALALSTDGLRYKILSDLTTGEPFGPFFEDIFKFTASTESTSAEIEAFIDALEDQAGDDKTLVVAVPHPPSIPVPAAGPQVRPRGRHLDVTL